MGIGDDILDAEKSQREDDVMTTDEKMNRPSPKKIFLDIWFVFGFILLSI